VDVDAAAGIGAGGDAGLNEDEVEGVAAAGTDDGEVLDDFLFEEVAHIAGGGGLDGLVGAADFDGFGDGAELEGDVDGGRLADGDGVVAGGELLEAGAFDEDGVAAGGDGFEDVGAGGGGFGLKDGIGALVFEGDGGPADDGG